MKNFCHKHNMKFTSASGCYFCRKSFDDLSNIEKYVNINIRCSCGSINNIQINKNENNSISNCHFCGEVITATRK